MNTDLSQRDASTFAGPDIVVVGAMRCATTTLYEHLSKLDAVEVTAIKETNFFLPKEFEGGLASFSRFVSNFGRPIVDISPSYSKQHLYPGTAKRIFDTNPGARLVYIVRDPVERAISEYNHLWLMGHALPAPEALTQTPKGQEIVATSRYAFQLEAFLEFWPLSNIAIVDYQQLIHQPEQVIADLFDWMGLSRESLTIPALKTNSTEAMQQIPAFWGPLRESRAGRFVRKRLPHAMNQKLKSVIFSLTEDQAPPAPFSRQARHDLAEAVREDAARFRDLVAMPFDGWTV